jgi:hypothetical protein
MVDFKPLGANQTALTSGQIHQYSVLTADLQDMVDCEPLMHVDSLGNSMALSRSDGSFAGCNPRYEPTLNPKP